MRELDGLLAVWLTIYLATGALVGPIVARKLRPYAAESDRGAAHWLADFFGTKSGIVVAVALWPLVVTVYRLGFFLGAWDWKASRPPTDRWR